MSKKWKVAMAVGGAVVAGSFALFRKLAPIRGERHCPYCHATDLYALRSQGKVLATVCLVCGTRYVQVQNQAREIDEAAWAELVEQAHDSD